MNKARRKGFSINSAVPVEKKQYRIIGLRMLAKGYMQYDVEYTSKPNSSGNKYMVKEVMEWPKIQEVFSPGDIVDQDGKLIRRGKVPASPALILEDRLQELETYVNEHL